MFLTLGNGMTMAWVLEVCGEKEHLFLGVHLMLEERRLLDVRDSWAS
jgi:hypothetical protein